MNPSPFRSRSCTAGRCKCGRCGSHGQGWPLTPEQVGALRRVGRARDRPADTTPHTAGSSGTEAPRAGPVPRNLASYAF
jgi:hypothetical protein